MKRLKVMNSYGRDDLARVFVADLGDGRHIEFVESLQPPIPRDRKWVLIISTSAGCPVRCKMCDAGGAFRGDLTRDEILSQIDYLVERRFPDRHVPVEKFKIQFARMGEPAFNDAVLDVLTILHHRYRAPGLMPCVSTIAPRTARPFMERLLQIRHRSYPHGDFQMQFSVHSTDEAERDHLMPVPKFTLEEIREYGERFGSQGNRKITLNFALAQQSRFDVHLLKEIFSPELFMFKITPLNPTYRVRQVGLQSYIDIHDPGKRYAEVDYLRACGFDVLISIGENEENLVGSNCGQYVQRHIREATKLENSYLYIK